VTWRSQLQQSLVVIPLRASTPSWRLFGLKPRRPSLKRSQATVHKQVLAQRAAEMQGVTRAEIVVDAVAAAAGADVVALKGVIVQGRVPVEQETPKGVLPILRVKAQAAGSPGGLCLRLRQRL